jgi:hypothetical protein
MRYFQNFEYEIKITIFKYFNSLNLALNWSVIIKTDPCVEFEWLICEKERALFHAIRLGPTVCQTLIAKKFITPEYFIYRLFELRMEHKIRDFQQKIKLSLASSLHTIVLDGRYNQFSNANENLFQLPTPEEFPSKDDCKNDKRNLIKFFDSLRQERLSRYY